MIRIAGLTMTALLLAAAPAVAQEQTPADYDVAPPDSQPLTAEEAAQLAAALQFDPSDPASARAKPLKLSNGWQSSSSFDMSRAAQRDGASTYTIKRTLPTLNAKIGADLGTGAAPTPYYQPDRPISAADRNTGAAWASVDVSGSSSVDARIDPTADQGRLATTLRHSVPVGGNLSLTLQNTSGVTDSLGGPAAATAPGLPLMTLPQGTNASARVWDDQPSVKFDIASTGTSLSAGFARSSSDPVTHNRLGADQKLYGPLHLSTAVTDLGEATENKSVSGSLKFDW